MCGRFSFSSMSVSINRFSGLTVSRDCKRKLKACKTMITFSKWIRCFMSSANPSLKYAVHTRMQRVPEHFETTETRRCFQTSTLRGVSLRAQVSRRRCCCQLLVCFLSRCGHDGIHSFQSQHKHHAENASSAQMALFCVKGIVVIWIQLFWAWFMC